MLEMFAGAILISLGVVAGVYLRNGHFAKCLENDARLEGRVEQLIKTPAPVEDAEARARCDAASDRLNRVEPKVNAIFQLLDEMKTRQQAVAKNTVAEVRREFEEVLTGKKSDEPPKPPPRPPASAKPI